MAEVSCPNLSELSLFSRWQIDWGAKPVNRKPVHVAKQWMPVDFMIYAAEGVALGTSVIIR